MLDPRSNHSLTLSLGGPFVAIGVYLMLAQLFAALTQTALAFNFLIGNKELVATFGAITAVVFIGQAIWFYADDIEPVGWNTPTTFALLGLSMLLLSARALLPSGPLRIVVFVPIEVAVTTLRAVGFLCVFSLAVYVLYRSWLPQLQWARMGLSDHFGRDTSDEPDPDDEQTHDHDRDARPRSR